MMAIPSAPPSPSSKSLQVSQSAASTATRGIAANYSNRFKVWISGQVVRRVTKAIRREMRRRAAIEPVIGYLKQDHRMGRQYLTGRDGDRINGVLAAAGYNFSLLLRWFEELFTHPLVDPLPRPLGRPASPNPSRPAISEESFAPERRG
jgi:hypothetical protein